MREHQHRLISVVPGCVVIFWSSSLWRSWIIGIADRARSLIVIRDCIIVCIAIVRIEYDERVGVNAMCWSMFMIFIILISFCVVDIALTTFVWKKWDFIIFTWKLRLNKRERSNVPIVRKQPGEPLLKTKKMQTRCTMICISYCQNPFFSLNFRVSEIFLNCKMFPQNIWYTLSTAA